MQAEDTAMEQLQVRVVDRVRHHLNPLHVMCLLVRCGIERRAALKAAQAWERCYKVLLG